MGEAGRAAAGPEDDGRRDRAPPARWRATVGDPDAVAIWRWLGWAEANADGVAGWAERAGGDDAVTITPRGVIVVAT